VCGCVGVCVRAWKQWENLSKTIEHTNINNAAFRKISVVFRLTGNENETIIYMKTEGQPER
jgi:hypothetical protein